MGGGGEGGGCMRVKIKYESDSDSHLDMLLPKYTYVLRTHKQNSHHTYARTSRKQLYNRSFTRRRKKK